FIRNTIDELLPNVPVNHTDLSIQFTKQNFQSQVRVVNLNADEARIYATIKNPNGQETTFELSKQTNQIFGGLFRTGVPGVYEIKITKQNMLGQQVSERTTYTTFSYSEEYNGFYDDVAMFEKMGEIAKNG